MSDSSKDKLGRSIEDIEMETIIRDYLDDEADDVLPTKKPKTGDEKANKAKKIISDKEIKKALKKKQHARPTVRHPGKSNGYKALVSQKEITSNSKVQKAMNYKYIQYLILGSKILLSVVILMFLISMFFSWVTITGEGATLGMIRIEKNITPDLDKEIEPIGEDAVSITRVADFSPIDLVGFALKFKASYAVSIDETGTKGTSTYSQLHLFFVYLFILIIMGALISVVLLLIGKNFQFTHIVRSIGLMSLAVMVLNYISLKVPFFSMIALRTQSILNVQNLEAAARVSNLGIVSGDEFYSYGLELFSVVKFAIVMLIIWIVLAAIMGEIKNKMDDYERMNQVGEGK